jgi:hypothetical protein
LRQWRVDAPLPKIGRSETTGGVMLRVEAVTKPGEGKKGEEERIFVKDGLRSFRKTFRVVEVYWGAGTGVVLLGIVGWVTWKGAHPDPSLFDMTAALEGGDVSPKVSSEVSPLGAESNESGARRAAPRLGAPRAEAGAAAAASGAALGTAAGGAARGPLPASLAQGGYREGKVGAFSSDDMYVKINGRAGYFQAFGARSLHTVTLDGPSEAAPTSVDIEVYDLGESRNAIGAYNGERPPEIESTQADGSTFHFDRNAAFLARGPYYVRFIGSDESAPVVAEVRRLLEVFRREIAGEALPWGFALFVDQLKLGSSAVTYVKSNAFSFGFARDVFKASLSAADSKDDMEAFVVALADPAAAKAMATQYAEGFASLGKPGGQLPTSGEPKGVRWIEDEFLGTFSGATAVERWVIGVRGAPSAARAGEELERLRQGLAALPEDVRARALPSSDMDEPQGEYGAAPATAPAAGGASASSSGENGPASGENEAPAAGGEAKPAALPGQPAEESSDEY